MKADNIKLKLRRSFHLPRWSRCGHAGMQANKNGCLPLAELGEKVAKLHVSALGAELTILTQEQADYIGVKVEGTFKDGHHCHLSCKVN